MIKDKIVCVTGAAGSIGSEVCKQLKEKNTVIALDINETELFYLGKELNIKTVLADITDKKRIEDVLDDYKPEIIIHCAAKKHVSVCEMNIYEAIRNNVNGTEIVAKAAIKYGVKKFIFLSTDKAVNPSSVMGTTKKIGEVIVRRLNERMMTEFVIVRFGNVKRSRGSAVEIFEEKIKNNKPIIITHPDMKRWFIEIEEAVGLTIDAIEIGKRGDIIVLDMGEQVNIMDLAKKMIADSGKDIEIIISEPFEGEKLKEELINSWEVIKEKKGKLQIIR